jgi:putative SOS response-associated peptidase YedK
VPASGFYEWKPLARGKQPWRIRPAHEPLFAFAGLWERWKAPDGSTLQTYTILTTDANEAVRPLHDRMPVIIAPADYARWLDASDPHGAELLRPCPPETLALHPVSDRVNNPRNDEPALIEPVAEAKEEP